MDGLGKWSFDRSALERPPQESTVWGIPYPCLVEVRHDWGPYPHIYPEARFCVMLPQHTTNSGSLGCIWRHVGEVGVIALMGTNCTPMQAGRRMPLLYLDQFLAIL
eukprot:354551-Chlamydomonas_euryale.AAC.2